MKNKNEFKEEVARMIKDWANEQGIQIEICETRVEKLDGGYDGLYAKAEGHCTSPVFNLDDSYEKHCEGQSLSEQVMQWENMFMNVPFSVPDEILEMDYEKIKPRLFVRLSGYEQSKRLLDSCPHILLEDMVITFHVFADESYTSLGCITVTNRMLNDWGITKEQLSFDALKSGRELFPESVRSLPQMFGQEETGFDSYVISNLNGVYGAAAMLYPGVIEKLQKKMGDSFFILPSSVNEVIAIPNDGILDPLYMKDMVMEINKTMVSQEDRLTDSVYLVDGREFRIAC